MMNTEEFVNLIIELIDLNEDILTTSHYDTLMGKRIELLQYYTESEDQLNKGALSDDELDSLELLQSYLRDTNIKVIAFLQKRLINLRIKERILEDRKRFREL